VLNPRGRSRSRVDERARVSRSRRNYATLLCLGLFGLLLLALSAVPVLAAQGESGGEPGLEEPSGAEGTEVQKLPTAADITAGIEKVEAEEGKEEAWLESPEATQAREASSTEFSNLDASEAKELLSETFSSQLSEMNADPARVLSEAQLLSSSEETSATIKVDGKGVVMESLMPVRTEDDEGDLRKVDVGLEKTGDAYETENGLVEVRIPEALDEPVHVGENGVSIKLVGADGEQSATPFGVTDVFASEVLPDTDMLVSPIATGVEISNVLRSEESPEVLRYQVNMPSGAELRAAAEGGFEVVKDEEILATIPEPTAVDAQETEVQVDAQIEGSILALTVAHQPGGYAMPILVDPIVENGEGWYAWANLDVTANWGFSKNVAGMYGSTTCIFECFPWSGHGLYVSGQSGYYWPNQYAQWAYSAPNANSYVLNPSLGPYVRHDHGCPASQYPQPHDYFGVWGLPGQWNYLSVNSSNQPNNAYYLPYAGYSVVFGLSTGAWEGSMPCWRDLYAGGALVYLDDWGNPSVTPVQTPAAGWIQPTTPVHLVAQASDAGLGVQNVIIKPENQEVIRAVPLQNQCSGTRRSLCLTGFTGTIDVHGASFGEGRRPSAVVAYDPTGKYSNEYFFETKVDGSPAQVSLSGQLASATRETGSQQAGEEVAEKLRLPVYNLTVTAEDGKVGRPEKEWQSGVKSIQFSLEGVPLKTEEAATCAHDCPLSLSYPVSLTGLQTGGIHTLEVIVTDFAGNVTKRPIEFEYFPATGMKDEYVMQYFPLPDGQGNEANEEHPQRPELAVNVMNGNLIYRETDVDVESHAALDLEVERYYNSMLPNSENTEWGDGWTLAQTPELEPIKAGGSQVPNEAEIVDQSGLIEGGLSLPTQAGTSKFDASLQASVAKTAGGGYVLSDETGELPGTLAFNSEGQAQALQDDGDAKVEYGYQGGRLAAIEVSDPSTFVATPAELEIPKPQLITQPAFASAFGSNGTADGQMRSPGDVAVDAQGNIWVVDKLNNRVEKFDAAGNFLAKFGTAGTGTGQFNRPTAIAIAANGDLLVTDAGNGRVERFNLAGTYLSSFGAKGTGNGQFGGSGPEGIAVDSAENIWVSDTYGGRLEKFNSAGVFQLSVGTKGSGAGQLGEPTGLDIAPNGEIWVADWQNNRVSKFSSAGVFQSSLGSLGTGDGQFKNPDEVEIDKLGNVWIGDVGNARVEQFDLTGQFKGKFGSAGTGPGQFGFAFPMGIAADSKGRLWVADVNNNRVQQWTVPIERPSYMSSFGSVGSTDGKLSAPGDVAVGIEGNILVVDKTNNRIQKFDRSGNFISKFGSYGTGDGQFNRPTAIAVDRDGNILVADSGNNRVEKFSPEGQFIAKFGTAGTGNGQFSTPEGVAADLEGNIWVADSGNGRIERFDEEGHFVAAVGSKGTGTGQLGKPIGIDVDQAGNVWVADLSNNRVSVFSATGTFVRQFGSLGSGNGQFNRPCGIEVDPRGNVWVTDLSNQRVQRFDLEGNYVGQFGSAGSGEGQFAFPTANTPAGIAVDAGGAIWVADVNHAKIQRWQIGNYQTAPAKPLNLKDGDPKVEVQTSGGLVTKVEGSAAGTNTYVHSGDDLTARVGPNGKVEYKYNSAGRMTEVKLPNGTWGLIAYQSDGRVEKVTVHIAGQTGSKTTEFSYQDTPTRRTTVFFPNAPHVTYDIAEDGSVLKWWNQAQPPVIHLSGNLSDLSNRETAEAISAGAYLLTARADDAEGIYSIVIIANGVLVDEWTCSEHKELACMEPPVNPWVMETGEFAPGVLNLEVVVTDQAEESAAERFWVNIPKPPPPSIGAPVAPTFNQIKLFRQEYGLEVVFPVVNELEFVERIWGLIGAWNSPYTPVGEVARTSWEHWGVPLRPEDVAELQYREAYVAQDGPLIREWAEANHPNIYAGYWVDHRAGGIIRVGFKASGSTELEKLLAEVKAIPGLAATTRIASFTSSVVHPISELTSLQYTIGMTSSADPALAGKIASVGVDIPSNTTTVGTPDVQGITNRLHEIYGSAAPVAVHLEALGHPTSRRYVNEGPIYGGEKIGVVKGKDAEGHLLVRGCTAAFGAWYQPAGGTPNQQHPPAYFELTAGHCFEPGDKVVRVLTNAEHHFEKPIGVGEGTNRKWQIVHSQNEFEDDGEAIRLNSPTLATAHVLGKNDSLPTITGVAAPEVGQTLCTSLGESNAVKCAPMKGPAEINPGYEEAWTGPFWQLSLGTPGDNGDSGAPVWIEGTNQAVGLYVFGPAPSLATPLLPPPLPKEGIYPWLKPSREQAMGLLNESFMSGLHIVTGN
jgi:tripartite motif-containing protein 71